MEKEAWKKELSELWRTKEHRIGCVDVGFLGVAKNKLWGMESPCIQDTKSQIMWLPRSVEDEEPVASFTSHWESMPTKKDNVPEGNQGAL